ncbi:hypothetical protein HRW23_23125 [Streptomyces lunaelactis]|uniref:hypothetical protein n=1 Tax=Streptomyces lunaelactis TaxID=1535768 RepID=UPI001584E12B|nr:hypothetical protein [Streptomyces lunaelactis]NUK56670.1 hypothetical protein [Streptomyces lunaelactis]NUK69588.1 hypothetical protein [Streptomyces lunaelactis]NUK80227.1 hypothetical protein [Streptomyces lunaelactis]
MNLSWDDFRLTYQDHRLELVWPGFSVLEAELDRCVSATLRQRGPDGGAQLVFQFRDSDRPVPGLLVIRVDVPARYADGAHIFTEWLHRRHGVPEHAQEAAEDTVLEQVPLNSAAWIAAPAGPASDELFHHVLTRIAMDTD